MALSKSQKRRLCPFSWVKKAPIFYELKSRKTVPRPALPGAVIGQSAIKGACPYSCNRFATHLVTPERRSDSRKRASILVSHTVSTAQTAPERTACTDACSPSTSDDKTASRSVTERMPTGHAFSHSRTSYLSGRFSPRFSAVSSLTGGFQGWGGIPALPAPKCRHRGNNRLYCLTPLYIVIVGPRGSSERSGSSNSISLPNSLDSKISRRTSLGMLSFRSAWNVAVATSLSL